jgi:hypothetical protein
MATSSSEIQSETRITPGTTTAMSDIKKRKQNREAQKKFREKQSKQVQQSRKTFEELTSKYEALLAENESLKNQHLAHGGSSARISNEPLEAICDPGSVEWSPVPLPDGCMAEMTDEFESELFSFPTPAIYPCTPQGNELTSFALETDSAGLPYDPSRDVPIPTIEHSLTTPREPPAAESWGLSRLGSDDSCLDPSTALLYPNPSLPPSLSSFDYELAGNAAGSVPRTDLVQALIQLAFTQERIALIDLEKAKLRVCTC